MRNLDPASFCWYELPSSPRLRRDKMPRLSMWPPAHRGIRLRPGGKAEGKKYHRSRSASSCCRPVSGIRLRTKLHLFFINLIPVVVVYLLDCRKQGAQPQNDAYHAVLSPVARSGRAGMYQPFMTSCRKPFLTRRSRWVRVNSPERAATRPRLCSYLRALRDSASFSCGLIMHLF